MTDCFALLQEARRPWLEPEALKEKFLALSADFHPDRVHQASGPEKQAAQQYYTALNTAYNRLRDPKTRLAHLLELEMGAQPEQVQRIPAELMDFAMGLGRVCRAADAVLAEKAKTSSPLLQVQLFERGQEWVEDLRGLQRQLAARREGLERELKTLDAEWGQASADASREGTLRRVEELYRMFSYVGRWSGQLQGRIVQFSL